MNWEEIVGRHFVDFFTQKNPTPPPSSAATHSFQRKKLRPSTQKGHDSAWRCTSSSRVKMLGCLRMAVMLGDVFLHLFLGSHLYLGLPGLLWTVWFWFGLVGVFVFAEHISDMYPWALWSSTLAFSVTMLTKARALRLEPFRNPLPMIVDISSKEWLVHSARTICEA